ncbi:GntR family transcriptional regulator [Saccharopolyspora gloriosae]|uniref:GntR family transcriptional regulator n=1 Tax=Saccharopolyspora gloriosae TaxID=455344 RepID=UPI001FB7B610|nr:GntR family transcriptional regulator [Saccharopolyspora gloriosae]
MESSLGSIRTAQRRGLADEAADRVREAIFAGVVAPGDPLREVELAASLDISRGAVREGLAVLAREGLVRSGWHRGTKVIEVTAADAEEVYALRAALERLAARSAAGNATVADCAELDRVVDGIAAELAAGAGVARLLALDIDFHDRIYRLAGNRRLLEAWQAIRSQIYLFQLTRVRLGDDQYRRIVVGEHRELVRQLRAGADSLEQAAEDHVRDAGRSLIAALDRQ